MTYDHHEKAGNQGDVVKHVALIAALDTILQECDQTTFRYADTFAGYAYSPIIQGNEWDRGIGRVVDVVPFADSEEPGKEQRGHVDRGRHG